MEYQVVFSQRLCYYYISFPCRKNKKNSDVCSIFGIPWVYSAILAFEGQLSVFNLGGDSPDYRDLLPTPPPPGDVPSCAEGGVLGVLPGTMGCLQATETIKIILGRTRPDELLSGRILVFDALKMRFHEIGLAKSPDRQPITSLIDYQGFCGGPTTTTQPPPPAAASSQRSSNDGSGTSATLDAGGRTMDEVEAETSAATAAATATATGPPPFRSIEPKECLDRLTNEGWSPWVLDVRLQTEHDIVALPFTDRLAPHRTVRATDVPPSGDVLVYCKAGVRGKKACDRLIEQGVDSNRLYNLDGGIMRWQQDVDQSMPRY